MAIQKAKELIDVGVIGNPTTGDILYDGGVKLNNMLNNIYNGFADWRLGQNDLQGVGLMTLHPMGYYQKYTDNIYASSPIELGSLHDVTTAAATKTITLPKGKAGEGVCIINTDGSFNNDRPLNIRPSAGDSIVGVGAQLQITVPHTKITLFCTEGGVASVWRYKVEALFGDEAMPIETTVSLKNADYTRIPVASKTDYNLMKFLLVAETTSAPVTFKSCEVLLHINQLQNEVYWSEYAVLKNGDDELYDLSFDVSGSKIIMSAKSLNKPLRLSIKAIDTVKAGTAV